MTYQLEEPFFEEKGRRTAQKEIGGGKIQVKYSSNETGLVRGRTILQNSPPSKAS
jgi:hypothetical protein